MHCMACLPTAMFGKVHNASAVGLLDTALCVIDFEKVRTGVQQRKNAWYACVGRTSKDAAKCGGYSVGMPFGKPTVGYCVSCNFAK